jgi:hypothetical protein
VKNRNTTLGGASMKVRASIFTGQLT